jgi:hypothetical protein
VVTGKNSLDYLVKLNESNTMRLRLQDHTGETLLDEVRSAATIANAMITKEEPYGTQKHKVDSLFNLYNT